MSNIKGRLLKHAKHVRRIVKPLKVPKKFMHENVPYFSQWESRDLAGQLPSKEITTDDDPHWKRSGAKTKKEYHDWSWSGCGMACTKMLLAYATGTAVPLGKKCAEYGGYTMPLETSIGLLYKPYVDFVTQEFGWKARIARGISQEELMYELSQGNYVIASVSPQIRHPRSHPKTKRGHLVLMLGYDQDRREFCLHNPSGDSKHVQESATVSFDDFDKFFSGQGIVVRLA